MQHTQAHSLVIEPGLESTVMFIYTIFRGLEQFDFCVFHWKGRLLVRNKQTLSFAPAQVEKQHKGNPMCHSAAVQVGKRNWYPGKAPAIVTKAGGLEADTHTHTHTHADTHTLSHTHTHTRICSWLCVCKFFSEQFKRKLQMWDMMSLYP